MDTLSIDTSKIERGKYKAEREDGRTFIVKHNLNGNDWSVFDAETDECLRVTDTKKMGYFDIRYDYLADRELANA
jgi:hypothetical protein